MADLTTAAATKSYLGITANGQDGVIAALISRESELIKRYCGIDFPSVTYTNKKMDGTGSDRIVLPGPPVLTISNLQILNAVVQPSSDGIMQPGYIFDGNTVVLLPGIYGVGLNIFDKFPMGHLNVIASWTGGYSASEDSFVPTGNTPAITPSTGGTAATDLGVSYTANGAVLTEVGSGPIAGQYTFAAGAYTFNSADYNKQVTMTYYYVPAPVEQACIEMVGLDLKQRDNLGVNSKSLAGETIAYTTKGMTDSVKELLAPFRRAAYV